MAKATRAFICHDCGTQYSKWQGKCNACGAWNTIEEELVEKNPRSSIRPAEETLSRSKVMALHEVSDKEDPRVPLADAELNRVLGGGLVAGSVILIGGEPGIGKSTLMLQLAMENPSLKVLYVSGEESQKQIKMRATRVNGDGSNCLLLADPWLDQILTQASEIRPDLMIVDSVQTLYSSKVESAPGTLTQIRECTGELIRFAKETGIPVFLIGHITKDGQIAGPKLLEHMVDTVLQFEGDRNHVYRILRAIKNRFGSTNEIGIYEMQGSGLRQVANPSEVLISQTDEPMSGTAISCSMEGMRPLMVEVQALVSISAYGTPQRTATGFDLRRMNMLLAVLEKRCGVKLGNRDVFLNITGGLRIDDPAADLALICAVLSSSADIALNRHMCFAAEVGLSGEIRPVQRVEQRIAEAARLGYESIVVSRYCKGLDLLKAPVKIIPAGKVEDVLKVIFG